jgi:hypothetical protein
MRCNDCSNESEPERTRCADCAERNRERERARWRRNHHCRNCDKKPLRGRTRCAEHAEWNRKAQLGRDRERRGWLLGGLGTDE